MRLLATTLFLVPLFAQQPPDARPPQRQRPAPTNLKLLDAANLIPTMRAFSAALGVECNHCHVQGNFASDDKPQKEVARKMIVMARQINTNFPENNMRVTCYTCHRGALEPATAPAGAAGGPGGGRPSTPSLATPPATPPPAQ